MILLVRERLKASAVSLRISLQLIGFNIISSFCLL